MDVYCEVCGIVTSASGDARGEGARACWACGTTLRARGRGARRPPAGVEERSPVAAAPDLPGQSRPFVPRDDDDPTMIDLRSLALKSFLATLPARNGAAAAPAPAPLVAVDAPPSVSDVLRVYNALAPIAAPPRARRGPRLRVLLAASAAGALAIAVMFALVAGHRSRARATGSAQLPGAQRGLAPMGELARSVSAPREAQGRASPAPRAPEAPAPEVAAGRARSTEAAAAPPPRVEVKPGARGASAAGASAAGARARPARPASTLPAPPPTQPALEAPRPPRPVSLADALAAAVADRPPPPAAPVARPREDATE
ncbi:uncharacterized protein SOCE26_009220 [Sorangium cellulosum]|uniref:Uncharacterized protein n=1 Tax=Sorangium cellulosum TaxID=56 RepID=A0A2L0EJR7_SORCE|nr:hypothetical protein [Sorangium cellulosum]AUX39529.1 uncharacterized protein SOCE26_009220 [Sorangium cellulosum]